jgi:hypothetical protein
LSYDSPILILKTDLPPVPITQAELVAKFATGVNATGDAP